MSWFPRGAASRSERKTARDRSQLLLVHSRILLDERDYEQYRRGQDGEWAYRCSGLDCMGLPVLVVAIIAILGAAALFSLAYFAVTYYRKRRAFRAGRVPASMVMHGYSRYTKSAGWEEPHKFAIDGVSRIRTGDEACIIRESECPVCLKGTGRISWWIELGCSHQLCERCFYRLVQKERLHAKCPLCREYLCVKKDPDTDASRGPLPGEELTIETSTGNRNRMIV
jgi:hypothetical protein